jgi:hypothetical protein
MIQTEYEKMMQELDLQKVGKFTRGELKEAFNKVANKENWKLPIDAIIHESEMEIVEEAVIFFTGSIPSLFDAPEDKVRVVSKGYYFEIGA